MNGMHYNGFGAWCAAYAFLNTINTTEITPAMYELLSGVPFGLKHNGNHKFKILTPFIEPCFMVEDTARLLGYCSEHWCFGDAAQAVQFMSGFMPGQRIMIGPVDMGWLGYLPQNMLYKAQSHYIAIEKRSQNHYSVIDSECVLGYDYTEEMLCGIFSVDQIPEAGNAINIWRFEKVADKPVKEKDYHEAILYKAHQNLMRAEKEGQGSHAVMACDAFLADKDMRQWGMGIYHEVNYMIQRKELAVRYQTDLIEQQIEILCAIRKQALACETIDHALFRCFADCEYELAYKIY